MSELIVRMEMPLNCERCPMSHWNKLNELTGCDAVGGKRYVSDDDEFWHMARPSWCPIIGELPEHGDLIDRDELKKHKRHSEEFCENIVSVAHIDWMPTIVPATERSECDCHECVSSDATTTNTKWESITIKTANKASDFWT